MATQAEILKLAETLYVEAMRSGVRERRPLPTDSAYWELEAQRVFEARRFTDK